MLWMTAAVTATGTAVGASAEEARSVGEGRRGSGRPLAPAAFRMLPLGEVRPKGWLDRQLRIQADGLGGHLDEFWPDVGANSGWLGGTGESWERGPYFVDGLLPLAYLLNDEALKAKALAFVNWTLDHQQANGMIGPASNDDWWPRMVMVKVLAQYGDATGDARVLPVLTRYFHYQLAAMPGRPLKDWGKYRWQDEVLIVEWLYERTRDPKLLELCALLKQQGFDWEANFANFPFTEPVTRAVLHMTGDHIERQDLAMAAHGVNNAEALKTAAVEYRLNGDGAERGRYDRQIGELDRYHGMPNGMYSADEHLGGLDPSHGTELCTVVETMFSMEVALATLGDAAIADRTERIAFNALPGTFTDDMWAHQYDQQPNQVQVSLNSKPWTTNGLESNLYGLEPHFGCCTANFHQGWPKFVVSLWMGVADGETNGGEATYGGLVKTMYAPCEVRTTVRGTTVHVVEETEYPFRETVRITVRPEKTVRFPMMLRIPGWAEGATVRVNGEATEAVVTPGAYARVEREWAAGDRVELRFPMPVRVSRWFNRSVALERGPLVFSLDPGESWVKLRQRGLTADWQVFPTEAWNYGLAVDGATAAKVEVVERPVGARPFAGAEPAVELRVKARRLDGWRSEDGVAQPLPMSPVQSANRVETLTLVPYAAAKLRITAFPQIEG